MVCCGGRSFPLRLGLNPCGKNTSPGKCDGKWSRSDEKPEHRVVSLSGSDGAEKQEGQSEGKGAHVVPAPVGPLQRADISPWIAINAA